MKRQLRPLIVFSFLCLVATSGLILRGITSHSVMAYAKDRYMDLQLFTKVLNLVQQYYVEKVDVKKLIYGGVKGMLGELDPHTNFLPPDIYKEFESETSGEFGGLGIEITLKKSILTVISPIEDTPAWKAGIKSGDKVVSINGESTKGLSLVEAAQKMRGKKGTDVRLGIFREGFEGPKEFVIKRGVVKIKSVKYTDLEDGFAYIRLTSFIEKSFKDFKKALEKHEKKNKKIKGLVIDLRRNPGGLLDQAVKLSDMFLDQGVIVSTVGRNKKEKRAENFNIYQPQGYQSPYSFNQRFNSHNHSESCTDCQKHKRLNNRLQPVSNHNNILLQPAQSISAFQVEQEARMLVRELRSSSRQEAFPEELYSDVNTILTMSLRLNNAEKSGASPEELYKIAKITKLKIY